MGTTICPPYLQKGDAVGIVAPARSVKEKEIEPFLKMIKSEGYVAKTGRHLFGQEAQYSGTVQDRLSDIIEFILDPSIKAIIAARGGYGSAQLLPGMDWELIRDNPKWLVGFSDITALHAAFGKFNETIHGVMPFSLSMAEPQNMQSFKHLFSILKGEKISYSISDHLLNIPGQVSGKLAGGNLSVLFSLSGTKYEADYNGSILFLEDLDEYLYHIDRMVLNFELRDIFRKINGLIIGDFSNMHDNSTPFQKNALEIIADRAMKYNVPSVFGFPAGHKKSNFPLIFGRFSTLTVKKGENSLLMY